MRISAIITAYNCASFIGEALESVFAQTHPVDEIVVVDDGSVDETAAIVRQYPEVRLILQANLGPGAARNRGIEATTGELIVFLDCDDIWLEDKIERQLQALERQPEAVMVTGDKWWWNVESDTKRIFGYSREARANATREIVFQNLVGNPSMVLLRRSLLEETGMFNPQIQWGQDWDLWMRIIRAGPICFLEEPLIIYRWHVQNLSLTNGWSRLDSYYEVQLRALRQMIPKWEWPLAFLRIYSNSQLQRALVARRLGQPFRYVRYAVFALLLYPFDRSRDKIKHFAQAILGARFYDALVHSRKENA